MLIPLKSLYIYISWLYIYIHKKKTCETVSQISKNDFDLQNSRKINPQQNTASVPFRAKKTKKNIETVFHLSPDRGTLGADMLLITSM